MSITFRLAWRNLWRRKRRTWLTVGAMIFSNALLVFMISLQLGMYGMMIENSLKASPFIKEAMVVGDGRKYLTALIGIELDVVGDWALRKNIPYTTYRDLTEKAEVLELVQGVVDETNAKFARVEGIKKFRMIPKELDHEDGELTATQKLKRSAMLDMFGDLVESMY